eukprot:CAMPEP_0119407064 /NCGR_PEP_ID=MMETSP1335-20130426/1128_1 /TAXON_ID=259385 /ORGANISM="Chrysoculter rhomboideus, Strain RCC1486" /LENGTH=237 /DNA_ID=CAMNT_0007431157 /DNA_START=1 /DNA_END=714 /DNA_ORIENTATION=+
MKASAETVSNKAATEAAEPTVSITNLPTSVLAHVLSQIDEPWVLVRVGATSKVLAAAAREVLEERVGVSATTDIRHLSDGDFSTLLSLARYLVGPRSWHNCALSWDDSWESVSMATKERVKRFTRGNGSLTPANMATAIAREVMEGCKTFQKDQYLDVSPASCTVRSVEAQPTKSQADRHPLQQSRIFECHACVTIDVDFGNLYQGRHEDEVDFTLEAIWDEHEERIALSSYAREVR